MRSKGGNRINKMIHTEGGGKKHRRKKEEVWRGGKELRQKERNRKGERRHNKDNVQCQGQRRL